MNKQENRYRSNRRRQRAAAKRRIVFLLSTLLLITIGTVVFGSCFSFAKDSESTANQEFKYYKSIMIESGDSLWSIAEEYKSEQYESTKDYVDELVVLNNLSSETIHAGQYLMVIYYDSEFK
jgi:cell division protein YceG involved in septum cleavage